MRKYLTINEIQNEEKEMLRKIIVFLNKNKISYYIYAGSFLGAVRHNGFIPWDDDIDLAIPRPDYNRLKNILLKNNNIFDDLHGIGFELNNSDWPFIKIVNKMIRVDEDAKADKYLWVDIFPLDGMPKRFKKLYIKVLNVKTRFFLYKRGIINNISISSSNIFKSIIRRIITFFLYPISYNYIISSFIKYASKYDYSNSDYVRNNVWSYSYRSLINKNKLEPALYDFEDIKVNGLKDYNYYLSKVYGNNYMELPPENKRITHNFRAWRINEDEKIKK